MGISVTLLAALVADHWFGEPRRGHPLIVFGRCAHAWEARFNHGRRRDGLLAVGVLVVIPTAAIFGVGRWLPPWAAWIGAGGLAMLAIGRHSLIEHARAIAVPLAAGRRAEARQRVAALVSRDTQTMDSLSIRRAALESILENASDAIAATIVWFTIGGWFAGPAGAAAGVVLHRLTNTLDAMWGYRVPRYRSFGWVAARLDDGLNWLPARLLAWAFVACGQSRSALACWREQARYLDSPNAGPVMTAGAGALEISLGGGARYHGVWRDRPAIGRGALPVDGDIDRALGLIDRAIGLIVVAVSVVALLTGCWP